MNPLKKLAGQTLTYGLSSIVGRMLNYLLVPFHLYIFGAKGIAEYGIISQLFAFVAFLNVLLTFGMETTYFRFSQTESDRKTLFNTSLNAIILLNGAFLMISLLFSQGIADFLLLSNYPQFIVMMALIVVIDCVSALPLAKLRQEEKSKQFVQIQLASIGINVFATLFFLYFFYDEAHPESGVFYILLANILSSLVKPMMAYKDFLAIRFQLNMSLLKKLLVYAAPLVLAGFAGIVNETFDRILLKQLLSNKGIKFADAQIGIYSACYKLAMLVTIVLQAYRFAAEPFFFSLYKDLNKNKIYVKTMNYFIAIVCLIFLGISLNIDVFKYFITHEAYWEGLHVVPILLMANVFFGIYLNHSIWFKLSGQTRYGAYISLAGAAVTLVINFVFIPIYGFDASAWATLAAYFTQMLVSYFLGEKHYPIKYNRKKFVLYIGVAVLIFFLVRAIPFGDHDLIRLIFSNLFIIIYIRLIMILEKIKFSDLRRKK